MATTFRRIADRATNQVADQTAGMRQYEVRVDGRLIGTVYQDRAETMTGYVGQGNLGYASFRTVWSWGDAGYEFDTRAEATTDMIDYVTSTGEYPDEPEALAEKRKR
jgi:hypothetical protein